MTIKISELANLTAVYGNVIVPVVANVAGTLITVKGNLDYIGSYIVSGTEANLLLANTIQSQQITAANIGIIGYVNNSNSIQTAYVNGQITAANAGVTAANIGMIGYVNQTNIAMRGYVDSTVQANVYSNINVNTYLTNSWSGNISGNVKVNGTFAVANVYVPTAANSLGIAGQMVWDNNYLYICVSADTWKRANIATW